jgi:hypothetical protein
MWSACFWSWTFANEIFGPWWSHFVSGSYWNNHVLQCHQEKWDCLEKSGRSLGMMWVSVASAHQWDCVGRTLRRSSSSVKLRGRFNEQSPYWCLIHPTSFWESIDDLASPFHGHFLLCLHFDRLKDARFLIILKFLIPVFNSFKSFRYTATT